MNKVGKYAFCFEHKVFVDEDNNNAIKEYFRPYPPEILIDVVKSNVIKQRLRQAIKKEQTFEKFIEDHNLQDEVYIIRLPENGNIVNSWWINDELNIDELSMWDYLADARAVVEAVRYGNT